MLLRLQLCGFKLLLRSRRKYSQSFALTIQITPQSLLLILQFLQFVLPASRGVHDGLLHEARFDQLLLESLLLRARLLPQALLLRIGLLQLMTQLANLTLAVGHLLALTCQGTCLECQDCFGLFQVLAVLLYSLRQRPGVPTQLLDKVGHGSILLLAGTLELTPQVAQGLLARGRVHGLLLGLGFELLRAHLQFRRQCLGLHGSRLQVTCPPLEHSLLVAHLFQSLVQLSHFPDVSLVLFHEELFHGMVLPHLKNPQSQHQEGHKQDTGTQGVKGSPRRCERGHGALGLVYLRLFFFDWVRSFLSLRVLPLVDFWRGLGDDLGAKGRDWRHDAR
mmetsp:Transcript_36915/g.88195  ORF Transcript_36915/g.88195 Transcript_36915/m.88195 type:complete len:334 (-) Transcript_36915:94-1095(-)